MGTGEAGPRGRTSSRRSSVVRSSSMAFLGWVLDVYSPKEQCEHVLVKATTKPTPKRLVASKKGSTPASIMPASLEKVDWDLRIEPPHAKTRTMKVRFLQGGREPFVSPPEPRDQRMAEPIPLDPLSLVRIGARNRAAAGRYYPRLSCFPAKFERRLLRRSCGDSGQSHYGNYPDAVVRSGRSSEWAVTLQSSSLLSSILTRRTGQ